MPRPIPLSLLSLLLALASCAPHADAPVSVVLVLVDDVGLADLGCFGSAGDPSPHIDSLARSGVLFGRAYASASICSPSRAGLLTGRYQQRFGHENNTGPLERQLELGIGLPASERLLSERLHDAGYATGLVGKWHLGAAPAFHPLERGFDEFFGHLSGGHTYLDWDDPKNGPILRGREPVVQPEGAYLTDALSDEAVAFIERHRAGPFFLLLSYNALHEPFEAPPEYLARHADVADPGERVRRAMLSALDDGIGRVLEALERHGRADDTLVCFVSDNGPRRGKPGDAGAQLRGGKLSLYEGGLRVPLIVRWPRRLSAGARVEAPVSTLDLVPTCLAAAGVEPAGAAPLDGRDLLPLARGRDAVPRTLFWRQGSKAAASDGELKLVRKRTGPVEAYDLARDPAEERPLDAGGERFAALRAALGAWEEGLAAPRWEWSGEGDGQPPGRR